MMMIVGKSVLIETYFESSPNVKPAETACWAVRSVKEVSMNDDAFLKAILVNPKDDAPLLIYSDWLEERGDAVSATMAEFLRVTVQLSNLRGKKGVKKA